ncbi:MAG TPA: hypothetical protein VGD80_43770 [Kofleriaceae bacterium]
MLASRPAFSSVTWIDRLRPGLPGAVETVVGGALEMTIHSIEGLRDRLVRRALLRALRATSAPAR